jgi:hypothetical protein
VLPRCCQRVGLHPAAAGVTCVSGVRAGWLGRALCMLAAAPSSSTQQHRAHEASISLLLQCVSCTRSRRPWRRANAAAVGHSSCQQHHSLGSCACACAWVAQRARAPTCRSPIVAGCHGGGGGAAALQQQQRPRAREAARKPAVLIIVQQQQQQGSGAPTITLMYSRHVHR